MLRLWAESREVSSYNDTDHYRDLFRSRHASAVSAIASNAENRQRGKALTVPFCHAKEVPRRHASTMPYRAGSGSGRCTTDGPPRAGGRVWPVADQGGGVGRHKKHDPISRIFNSRIINAERLTGLGQYICRVELLPRLGLRPLAARSRGKAFQFSNA